VLSTQLRYEDNLMVSACTWFELVREACQKFIPKRRVHADEIEAAMGLYLAPRIVRKASLTKGTAHPDPYPFTDPGTGGGFEVPYRWEELTPNGAYGDARRATVAMGKELTDAFLTRAGEFVEAFVRSRPHHGGKKRNLR
jgi:creatinine amidohydrolase